MCLRSQVRVRILWSRQNSGVNSIHLKEIFQRGWEVKLQQRHFSVVKKFFPHRGFGSKVGEWSQMLQITFSVTVGSSEHYENEIFKYHLALLSHVCFEICNELCYYERYSNEKSYPNLTLRIELIIPFLVWLTSDYTRLFYDELRPRKLLKHLVEISWISYLYIRSKSRLCCQIASVWISIKFQIPYVAELRLERSVLFLHSNGVDLFSQPRRITERLEIIWCPTTQNLPIWNVNKTPTMMFETMCSGFFILRTYFPDSLTFFTSCYACWERPMTHLSNCVLSMNTPRIFVRGCVINY